MKYVSAQCFEGAHRNSMYLCIFIEVNTHIFILCFKKICMSLKKTVALEL
jgi:hypothetical protein